MKNDNPFDLEVASIRLVKDAPIYSDKKLTNPQEVVALLGDVMCEFDREVVAVINFKADMTPINVHFASMGAINYAVIHPREMFKTAILSNATSIMMLHNHPSGNLTPSIEDTKITDRMIKACDIMDIPLLDHIIVGGDNNNYFSFNEKSLIRRSDLSFITDYRDIKFNTGLVAEKKSKKSIDMER